MEHPATPHPLVSVTTAAAYLGVSPRTLRRWLRTGLLPGQKVGTSWSVWWPGTAAPEATPPAALRQTVRARQRQVGAALITVGNQIAVTLPRRGAVFLAWRTPHGVQVVLAIGRRHPTQGWRPHGLGVELPFWLRERVRWRPVLPLLRRYERLRQWSHPRLLGLAGVAPLVLAELDRLDTTLGTLAAAHGPHTPA